MARAAYRPSDFALRYALEEGRAPQGQLDAQLGVRPPKWLCIADTLVLVFDGLNADLVAFDAYTNRALWRPTRSLGVPEALGTGSLRLAAPPRDTDRVDLGVIPQYQYAESEAHLRISLGRPGAQHYRISTCLVVGIDAQGIATLDVSDLRLQE
ncbi:MAG TPA: hypothetical protein VFA20_31740 [Myxococcaceae bacterium]|nr:hypothetical protein [Myxococcaceae bacterium]